MSTLSEDDFIRLQTQLVDLKTCNYQLEDTCRKQTKDLVHHVRSISTLTAEVEKANKIINKSKKTKEVQQLLSENQQLHLKITSQEHDFSLQNDTLLTELNRLTTLNEQYESDKDAVQLDIGLDSGEQHPLHECENIETLQNFIEKLKSNLKSVISKNSKNSREKDELNEELSKRIATAEKTGAEDSRRLLVVNEKLEHDIDRLKQRLADISRTQEQNVTESASKLKQMQDDLQSANKMHSQRLQDIEGAHSNDTSSLNNKLNDLENENAIFIVEIADLKEELTSITVRLRDTESCATDRDARLKRQTDTNADLEQRLTSTAETSDKRKKLMSELVTRLETEKSQRTKDSEKYHREFEEMKATHATFACSLKEEILLQKEKLKDQEDLLENFTLLEQEKLVEESVKRELYEKLNVLEEKIKLKVLEFKTSIEHLESSHRKEVSTLMTNNEAGLKEKKKEITSIQEDITTKDKKIILLEQKLQDSYADSKLHEKKISASTKDLKRQLQSERRKVERMQELLQKSISKNSSGDIDELFTKTLQANSQQHDTDTCSSVSSLCASQTTSEATPPTNTRTNAVDILENSCTLEKENSVLLSRLTDLQQQKWELEEKVILLESNNALMTEELSDKRELIEHYIMNTGRRHKDPPEFNGSQHHSNLNPFRKLVDKVSFTVDAALSDDNIRIADMNKRLQIMVEETLTKNMHLQKSLQDQIELTESLKKFYTAKK